MQRAAAVPFIVAAIATLALTSWRFTLCILIVASTVAAAYSAACWVLLRLAAWIWDGADPQLAHGRHAGGCHVRGRELRLVFPKWWKLQHVEVREAVLCWGRAPEAASSDAAAAKKPADLAGDTGQPHAAPDRWGERGITLSGVRVITRTLRETAPGSGGGAAALYGWWQACGGVALSGALLSALGPFLSRLMPHVPVSLIDLQVSYTVSGLYPATVTVPCIAATVSLTATCDMELTCEAVKGIVSFSGTPAVAFSSTHAQLRSTGLARLEAEYGDLFLLPYARQLAMAAEAIAADKQRLESHLAGQLLVRCGPGKASYDGWHLTSSSSDLQVVFLALLRPLGGALEAISRVDDEGIASARLVLLQAAGAKMLVQWARAVGARKYADSVVDVSSNSYPSGGIDTAAEPDLASILGYTLVASHEEKVTADSPGALAAADTMAKGTDSTSLSCTGRVEVHLQNALVEVQQSSPTYHKASAALSQLASDCRLLAETCEAAAHCCTSVQISPSATELSTTHSNKGKSAEQRAVQSKKASPLVVTIDGCILRIDDSEASCARLHYDGGLAAVTFKDARLCIVFKVLFQRVPVLVLTFSSLSYDLRVREVLVAAVELEAGRLGPVRLFNFAARRIAYQHASQDIILEDFTTKYVGQALGGGRQWRGKLSETTDVSGNRVYRTTRTVAVPPGFTFTSVYRSGAAAESAGAESLASTAQHFGLLRLRGLDVSALPDMRSRVPRAGFGIDILPAWRYGLRWDAALENTLLGI